MTALAAYICALFLFVLVAIGEAGMTEPRRDLIASGIALVALGVAVGERKEKA